MRTLPARAIKRRVAANTPKSSQGPTNQPDTHQSNDYLHLAAEAFGCNRAPIPPQLAVTFGEIETALASFRLSPADTLIGLNPGAEYGPAKRWPMERFIEAALAVRREIHARFLVFGLACDAQACSRIAGVLNAAEADTALDLSGKTSLRELMALMKCCRAVLTNDTGPMHVAAALGTPVIVPFGSSSPALTGPMPPDNHHMLRAEAPCSPCFRRTCPTDFRCMLNIESAAAAAAILKHATRNPARTAASAINP
jgi:heptosyltransferase II